MNMEKKITVAVVGLWFGAHLAEIYAAHPDVKRLVLVDQVEERVRWCYNACKHFSSNVEIYDSFEDVLKDSDIDAVQITTGIPSHAELTIKALNAGKHCACAVPMATSLEDLKRIVETVRKTGKKYMMLETMIYGTPFLYAQEMLERGEFGKIQYMRGVHLQPMEGWPDYWNGLPPMHYATHAIAPLRVIAGSRIKEVVCIGSGTMSEELVKQYNNPYPVEDALLKFENGLGAEVVRSLFECSMKQSESYNIYGSKKSFMYEYKNEVWEWLYDPAVGNRDDYKTDVIHYPNRYELLPEEIQRFTIVDEFSDDWKSRLDTAPWSVHEASHPHMIHEFVTSILEDRKPFLDEELSANITAAGICAHISAMNGGTLETVPEF